MPKAKLFRGRCRDCCRWVAVLGTFGPWWTWPHLCLGRRRHQCLATDVQTPERRCSDFVRAIVPAGLSEADIQVRIDTVLETFGYR